MNRCSVSASVQVRLYLSTHRETSEEFYISGGNGACRRTWSPVEQDTADGVAGGSGAVRLSGGGSQCPLGPGADRKLVPVDRARSALLFLLTINDFLQLICVLS